MAIVSIVKAQKDGIRAAIERTMELSGPLNIKKNAEIVIKLNLCALKTPDTGVISDPRVVEAFLAVLRERHGDANVTLVESDATSANADLFFEWFGYNDLAKRYGCNTKNLSKDETASIELENIKFKYPKTVVESDFFVSMAKMKTCVLTKISCSLKNQFGCIPYWKKDIYHKSIDEIIAQVNKVRPPDFCLVDGIIAHEGTLGPSAGKPKHMGLIVGGKDPVAVDSTCARIMGFNPRGIGHIQKARKFGVGSDAAQIAGERIEDVGSKFKFSSWERWMFNTLMNMRNRSIEWQ